MTKTILCNGRKMKLMIYAIILMIGCSPIVAQENDPDDDMAAVMRTLKLNPDNCPEELMAKKAMPNMDGHTVYVILENTEKESDDFFVFDCHIVIREDATGKTVYSFHEKGAWESDAVAVRSVIIDTAPYMVNTGQRAFGVRVVTANNSRVAQFSETTISLFVPRGGKLARVLNKFPVVEHHSDWDGNCDGEFVDTEKILMMSGTKTNGYFNIIVKSTVTTSVSKWIDDDCVAKDTVSRATQTLRFVEGEYK